MINTNIITRPLNNLSQFSKLRDDFFFPIQETFDRFFQDFWGADNILNSVKGKGGYPKMEIGTEGDYWVVRVAVPGVKEEDLLVQIDETGSGSTMVKKLPRILRIQGQMAEEYQSPEGAQYFVRELRKSKFVREVVLPDGLTGEPDAMMKNGVLTLKWQKPQEDAGNASAIKKITVKTQ